MIAQTLWETSTEVVLFERIKTSGDEEISHSTLAHVEPSPWNVPPAEPQLASVSSVHVPSSAQHAPNGSTHGFGEQLVPSPWYVPPSVPQSAGVSTVQVSPWQHAPLMTAVL